MPCREHSTGALALLEVFLINHLEIGLRVSRAQVHRIKVLLQLLLSQDQDLLRHKEHQEEALVEAVLLTKTCRRGLPI